MKLSLKFDNSGATSTSVWVVVDGKVDERKTETVNVGGWHVSQFLKQAVTWRDHKEAAGVCFINYIHWSIPRHFFLLLFLRILEKNLFNCLGHNFDF